MTYPKLTDPQARKIAANTLWRWRKEARNYLALGNYAAHVLGTPMLDWIYGYRRALSDTGND